MAKKKKNQNAEPVGAGGFDDVDDFFFGSEAGAFKREEFDYDPFEDHASIASGTFEAPDGAPDATRAALKVPPELRTAAGKSISDDGVRDKEKKGAKSKSGKSSKVEKAAVRKDAGQQNPKRSAKQRKADDRKRKAEEKKAAAAAKQKEAEARRKAEEERRAAEKKRRDEVRREDQERRDREAREAEERRLAAKRRKEEERQSAERKREKERQSKADQRRKDAEQRREQAAARRKEANEAADQRAAEAKAELARKAEEERLRRDEEKAAAKKKAAADKKRREAVGKATEAAAAASVEAAPEAAVPLSERRAAGRAAAEAMMQEEVVIGGDVDDDDASEVATSDLDGHSPSVAELPGAGEWQDALLDLATEIGSLGAKKHASKRSVLRFERGRILAHRVGDWRAAQEEFEAALSDDPKNLAALRELVRIFAAAQDWSRAVDLLARQAEAADDDETRSAALLGSAHIQLSQLDRLPEAAVDLQRALQIFGDNYIALRFLREIHYRTQNWSALVEVLGTARGMAGPGERLRIDYELGRLHDEVLKDPPSAIEGFRACLQADGRFIPAYLAAERLLTEAGRHSELAALHGAFAQSWGGADAAFLHTMAARAAAGAEDQGDAVHASYLAAAGAGAGAPSAEEHRHWLESKGRWDDLEEVARAAAEGDTGARMRSHLYAQLGSMALQNRGDANAARAHFDAAVGADPTSVEAREGRRSVLRSAGDWDALLAHLSGALEASTDLAEKLAYRLEMAEVCEVRKEDLAGAREHLEAAVDLSPNYLPALDSLSEVLRRSGDHSARAERLAGAGKLVETSEARACYSLRAAASHSLAGERSKAVEALQAAASDGPGPLLARELLVEALIDEGEWGKAAETLRQAAAEADDTALRVSLFHRAGRIALHRSDDLDAAEAAYRSLLDLSEDFLPAWRDLRDIHLARGDWDAVGQMQQDKAERRTADGVRAWWHVCAGQSYERAGRVDDALSQYRDALEIDGADPVANASVRRVLRTAGDYAGLADACGDQLRRTADTADRDALRVQLIGTLVALGDAPSVATEVNELLKSDRVAELPLAAMGVLCESLQVWDEAVRAYEAVGARDGADVGARAAAIFQQGLLLEEVQEDASGAVGLYEKAHELSGGHAMALEGLERVRAQQEDGAALSVVYAREAEGAQTAPVRTFYALLAGEQAENLGKHDEAVAAYRQAFQDPVGRDRAYESIRRLALSARDPAILGGLTENLVGERKGNDAVSRWMELGEGLAGIGADDAARDAFGRALALRPGFLPAHLHLERLHREGQSWNQVLVALEAIATAANSTSVKNRVEERTQQLLEEKGVTSDGAWDFYKKLHSRDAKNLVALRGLGSISLIRGDYDGAKVYFEEVAAHAEDPIGKAEAGTQLARVLAEQEGDDEGAVKHLEVALGHESTYAPALELLGTIHSRTENWSGLVTVLARQSALVAADQRVGYFVRIADLWETRLDNSKVAVASWNKVLQEDPDHPEAQKRLLALYEKAQDWPRYLDVADRGLGVLEGSALRARQAELGGIALDRADLAERAVAYFEDAIKGEEPAVPALRALRELADSRGDWERVIALATREADVVEESASRVALYEDAARIRMDELLDADGAAEIFAKALALDPGAAGALQFFVAHHFDNRNWEDAAKVFAGYEATIEAMDLEEDDDARIEATAFHYKYGVVLGHTANTQAAVERFGRALELTPTHLPSLEAAAPRYLEAGELERARATYRSILRLRGGTGDGETMTALYLQLARTELQLGQSDSALKRFKKVLQLSKNNVDALQGIARIHRLSEDWNSLLSTYNSIIKYARDPDQVIRAYMTKGDVLEQKLKFTDKAVLHYEKVLMYDKQNVQAMTRLGQIALSADDTERAADFASKAVEAADLVDDRIQAALLEKLAEAGDPLEIAGVVEGIRAEVGDGEALSAFSSAFQGADSTSRADAAAAYREAFATF